jgi:coenzyme F420 hydrogenase subunit beta
MTAFDALLDRISIRDWTEEDVAAYLGSVRKASLSHASDAAFREMAASGGSVTALLWSAIESNVADAALVVATSVTDGKVRGQFVLARTKEELLAAQGSKYVAVNFVRDALPIIRDFDGRLAVVALPCDITMLNRRAALEPDTVGAKIALTVGLFCSHNSRTELVDMVTARIERQHGAPLQRFVFRTGHWRGRMSYELEDGTNGSQSTSNLNDYRNLSLFSERKCLSCNDHFAYDADISAGDVWLYALRERPIKPTILLIRSMRGEAVYEAAVDSGALTAEAVAPRLALDGQARSAPHHHDTAARRSAGRLLGVRIRSDRRRTRPVAFVDAFITVAGTRLTETARGRRLVALVPRPLIRALLVVRKGIAVLVR